ncbi:MAG: S9 family peptidase [Candidatus Eremiobacteraeota bacterium]|nr:S9 family peptidase [Candidatus Eremiobacteraeota bacterium]MBC5802093.1 S9 family peptidase [Candidatus Eremiobacteraeota bacterium]MBC5822798.1 S9 family peptidase [Candidatus Eremiobacteraeota bacterium]
MCAPASAERLLHNFGSVSISPDGTRVVSIESTDPVIEGDKHRDLLVVRRADGTAATTIALPCAPSPDCVPSEPVWSPDGKRIVFILRAPKAKTRSLYAVSVADMRARKLLDFDGVLNAPRFSPSGRLAVLATAGAHKEIGATQAGAALVGEIGAHPDEQRIALVDGGRLDFVSPADMFVYEYDWRPDVRGFVGTAAHGNGDNNWWIAKLYAFRADKGQPNSASLIYSPASPQQQLADPRISADGRYVAFIGGIMSDFGSTGGDVYVLPLRTALPTATQDTDSVATDVTPNLPASATSLVWDCRNDTLLFSDLRGPNSGIERIDAGGSSSSAPRSLWSAQETPSAADAAFSKACNADRSAVVMQDFEHPPEIAVGPIGNWRAITHANAGIPAATHAVSVSWKNDAYDVDGWLLAPLKTDTAAKHAMITIVHGGPSAAYRPAFVGRGTTRAFLQHGYYVFLPNPRGSYGQGETFTLANVKDFGYGDLRDVLSGIDAVEKQAPIDENRLGLTGYSYGGYMTMWTVTQTNRFKAAVAGAGVSDWLSYYGENGIDQWMIPFFGASVYDDPAVYAKSSPITFVKNVKTPTFEYVGQNDVECPLPQTQEFWHALQTFNVPTDFVVYAGEGHGLRGPAHRADAEKRTIAWFDRYLGAPATTFVLPPRPAERYNFSP